MLASLQATELVSYQFSLLSMSQKPIIPAGVIGLLVSGLALLIAIFVEISAPSVPTDHSDGDADSPDKQEEG